MNLTGFMQNVDEHPELTGVDIILADEPDEDAFVILHKKGKIGYRVLVDTVQQETWETLEPILTGQRQAEALYHISRVVGYFSRLENWNQSKLGEHKDRMKGNYGIGEKSRDGR